MAPPTRPEGTPPLAETRNKKLRGGAGLRAESPRNFTPHPLVRRLKKLAEKILRGCAAAHRDGPEFCAIRSPRRSNEAENSATIRKKSPHGGDAGLEMGRFQRFDPPPRSPSHAPREKCRGTWPLSHGTTSTNKGYGGCAGRTSTEQQDATVTAKMSPGCHPRHPR